MRVRTIVWFADGTRLWRDDDRPPTAETLIDLLMEADTVQPIMKVDITPLS